MDVQGNQAIAETLARRVVDGFVKRILRALSEFPSDNNSPQVGWIEDLISQVTSDRCAGIAEFVAEELIAGRPAVDIAADAIDKIRADFERLPHPDSAGPDARGAFLAIFAEPQFRFDLFAILNHVLFEHRSGLLDRERTNSDSPRGGQAMAPHESLWPKGKRPRFIVEQSVSAPTYRFGSYYHR